VQLHALGIHGGWTIVCPACHCGLMLFSAACAILALSSGQSLDSPEGTLGLSTIQLVICVVIRKHARLSEIPRAPSLMMGLGGGVLSSWYREYASAVMFPINVIAHALLVYQNLRLKESGIWDGKQMRSSRLGKGSGKAAVRGAPQTPIRVLNVSKTWYAMP
jgi:hypothetical protein